MTILRCFISLPSLCRNLLVRHHRFPFQFRPWKTPWKTQHPIDAPSIPQTLSTVPIVAIRQPVDRVRKKKKQSYACGTKRRAKERGTRFQPIRSNARCQSEICRRCDCGPSLLVCEDSSGCGYGILMLPLTIASIPGKTHRLHELVGPMSTLGLTLQEWDGMLSAPFFLSYCISDQLSRTPTPIIERGGLCLRASPRGSLPVSYCMWRCFPYGRSNLSIMNVTPNPLPFNSRPRACSAIHTSSHKGALFAPQPPTPKDVIVDGFH